MVLAGHGRLEAARLEGLTQVPTVCFDHLTAAQKRAFLIADNRIAEQAGWDREMLAIELGELVDLLPIEGLDVSVTGFETSEIDLLFADMAGSRNEPPEAIPSLPRNAVLRSAKFAKRRLCGSKTKIEGLSNWSTLAVSRPTGQSPSWVISAVLSMNR